MIKLDTQPYCENCPRFDADVETINYDVYDDERAAPYVYTTIRCKSAVICKQIYDLLKERIETEGK